MCAADHGLQTLAHKIGFMLLLLANTLAHGRQSQQSHARFETPSLLLALPTSKP
jgi:hypothetical protein